MGTWTFYLSCSEGSPNSAFLSIQGAGFVTVTRFTSSGAEGGAPATVAHGTIGLSQSSKTNILGVTTPNDGFARQSGVIQGLDGHDSLMTLSVIMGIDDSVPGSPSCFAFGSVFPAS